MQSLKGVPQTRIPLSPSLSSLEEDEFPSIDDLLARFTLTRPAPSTPAPTPTRQTPKPTPTPRRAAPKQSTSTATGSRLPAPTPSKPRATATAAARSPRPPTTKATLPVPPTPSQLPSTPTKNALADKLFPTPPRATPLSTPARRERSPTHVSDSEPEHFLPSARKAEVVEEKGSRKVGRPRPSFLIEDSEDERRAAASAPLFKLTTADEDVLILCANSPLISDAMLTLQCRNQRRRDPKSATAKDAVARCAKVDDHARFGLGLGLADLPRSQSYFPASSRDHLCLRRLVRRGGRVGWERDGRARVFVPRPDGRRAVVVRIRSLLLLSGSRILMLSGTASRLHAQPSRRGLPRRPRARHSSTASTRLI